MSFRDPLLILLAVVLVAGAAGLAVYAARRRREAIGLFLGPRAADQIRRLRPLAQRRTVRAALTAAALGCLGFALAGPRVGQAVREGRQESLDLVIALDLSESMRTQDVAPSRLERAVFEVERIVEARQGDRIGLVVFAGDAFLQCPLTTDRSAVRLFLDAVDPEQIELQGTDFSRALSVVQQAFDAAATTDGEAATARPRAVLVVSDGEDHEGGLGDAAEALRQSGVTLLALGVGTDEGGPVPDVRRGRAGGFKRDRQGETVVSRYQGGTLDDIAGRSGVVRVGEGGSAAERVNRELAGLDRATIAEERFAASAERFQWPLALGVLFLLAERAVARRRLPLPR